MERRTAMASNEYGEGQGGIWQDGLCEASCHGAVEPTSRSRKMGRASMAEALPIRSVTSKRCLRFVGGFESYSMSTKH